MPHRAESSSHLELARGFMSNVSTSPSPSSEAPFQQALPPTAPTPSPPYPKRFVEGHRIESSYDNLQPMPWYQYDSIHKVEPSPSRGRLNDSNYFQEQSLPHQERHSSHARTLLNLNPSNIAVESIANNSSCSELRNSSADANQKGSRMDGVKPEATLQFKDFPEGNVPLKKRKKHLRCNQEVFETHATVCRKGQPYHISPASSSSLGSGVIVEDRSPEESLSVMSSNIAQNANTQLELSPTRSNSYDLKEALQLPDSAKINNSADICSSSELFVPQFPLILHNVLTQPEFESVLQWLPHGKAWKVLRWDALRRQVLPMFFQESDRKEGSIDSFLLQLKAWGFEEIKDGPDVGAYRHQMFLRGKPDLCQNMRLSSRLCSDESSQRPCQEENEGCSGRTSEFCASNTSTQEVLLPSSMLRSRSVGSNANGDASPKFSVSPITRPTADPRNETPSSVNLRRVPRQQGHPEWPPSRDPTGSVVASHTYRPEEGMASTACTDVWLPYPSFFPRMPALHGDFRSSCSPAFTGECGYPLQQPQLHLHRSPCGPMQVLSGRGAMHLTNRNLARQRHNQPIGAVSYPVSHRGRGAGTALARRVPLPRADLNSHRFLKEVKVNDGSHSDTLKSVELDGIARQSHRTDVSGSRKSKRKLPLARKSSLPVESDV